MKQWQLALFAITSPFALVGFVAGMFWFVLVANFYAGMGFWSKPK